MDFTTDIITKSYQSSICFSNFFSIIWESLKIYWFEREQKQIRKAAAIKIQSLWRMDIAKNELQKRQKRQAAAIKIQSLCRMDIAKNELQRRKKRQAAIKIQSLWRNKIAKNELQRRKKRQAAAIKIQSLWRNKIACYLRGLFTNLAVRNLNNILSHSEWKNLCWSRHYQKYKELQDLGLNSKILWREIFNTHQKKKDMVKEILLFSLKSCWEKEFLTSKKIALLGLTKAFEVVKPQEKIYESWHWDKKRLTYVLKKKKLLYYSLDTIPIQIKRKLIESIAENYISLEMIEFHIDVDSYWDLKQRLRVKSATLIVKTARKYLKKKWTVFASYLEREDIDWKPEHKYLSWGQAKRLIAKNHLQWTPFGVVVNIATLPKLFVKRNLAKNHDDRGKWSIVEWQNWLLDPNQNTEKHDAFMNMIHTICSTEDEWFLYSVMMRGFLFPTIDAVYTIQRFWLTRWKRREYVTMKKACFPIQKQVKIRHRIKKDAVAVIEKYGIQLLEPKITACVKIQYYARKRIEILVTKATIIQTVRRKNIVFKHRIKKDAVAVIEKYGIQLLESKITACVKIQYQARKLIQRQRKIRAFYESYIGDYLFVYEIKDFTKEHKVECKRLLERNLIQMTPFGAVINPVTLPKVLVEHSVAKSKHSKVDWELYSVRQKTPAKWPLIQWYYWMRYVNTRGSFCLSGLLGNTEDENFLYGLMIRQFMFPQLTAIYTIQRFWLTKLKRREFVAMKKACITIQKHLQIRKRYQGVNYLGLWLVQSLKDLLYNRGK